MDWRAGHLTTTEGTGGGAFTNKNCPQGRVNEQFFQIPGVCPGVCPGGCSRLDLTRTLRNGSYGTEKRSDHSSRNTNTLTFGALPPPLPLSSLQMHTQMPAHTKFY